MGDPPVQMLDCRQIRSSSSSSSHSSSLPLTGRPESTSRQARKRRWSDTRPEAFPPEDAGIHGEQEVHSDHSLTITERQTGIYIYIYAFSRRFYPKRLTLHSSYSFGILSALAFPGNRTHDLGVASAMLNQLSYRKALYMNL